MKYLTLCVVVLFASAANAGAPQLPPTMHLRAQTATWTWDETRPLLSVHFEPSPFKGYYLTTFDWADTGPDTQLHTDDVAFDLTLAR